jgi:MFS transporter, OFA family, oxalate/formate antiporter
MAMPSTPQKLPRYPWIGKRPFYGWVIVAVSSMTQFTQGVVSQGFSTYLGPLQQEFGWSKALLAGPRSVTTVENSILGPIEGFLMDKLGPRNMVAIGTFLMGLGLILFGLTHSLWMYYLSNVIITLGSGLQGLLVLSVAINSWFRRKRTLAQSLMGLGYAMAGVVGVPVLVFTQTTMGWRTSAIATGLIIWAVGFPCSMLLRRNPEQHGLLPDGAPAVPAISADSKKSPAAEYDFTLREALRTRAFWLLALGQALSGLAMGVTQVHLFLHLEQGVGLSPATSALVWSVTSISNIPARLLGGFLGDKLAKNLILAAATVSIAAAILILGLAGSLTTVMVFALLYGIGWGARTPVTSAIQGEYFGRRSQGIIRGWLQSFTVPFTVAAPIVAGYLADLQGSYRMTFVIMAFISLAGACAIFLATAPKQPHRPI